MDELKRKRQSYKSVFKIKVVAFAEIHGNSNAMREFNVDEKLIRDWRKIKEELNSMPRTKRARRGNISSFPILEEELNIWVVSQRQEGYIVTRNCIRLRALQLKKSEKYKTLPGITTFLASAGWCSKFMDRFSLTLRQRTKIAQKLPAALEEKLQSFHRFVIKHRKLHDYDLSQIGNMDETPITFDMPPNRTVNSAGAKTIMIKTTGHEKTRFTVVLACMANGTKLKPVVIFKRKTLPKNVKFVSGVIVQAHPNGWMDETGIQKWLHQVWNCRPGAMMARRSMLVWDMFRAHITESVKKTIKDLKSDTAVIPGGLTSVLQPLDVCLNKPFKDRLRKKWIEWMTSSSATLTKGGNLMKPDIIAVVAWIKEAWDSIPIEMVIKSFLKCGISNAMDGSEDNYLYEEIDDMASGSKNENDSGEETEDYTVDIDAQNLIHDGIFRNSDTEIN
jgi:hypothetical protein